jgi:hypothetical protein
LGGEVIEVSQRKDGAYIKSLRIADITKMIALTFPGGANVENLLDQIEFRMGLRRDTARRYIELIKSSQGWVEQDGVITPLME